MRPKVNERVRWICCDCHKEKTKDTPRVVIKGSAYCGDCAYKREVRSDPPMRKRARKIKVTQETIC